MLLEIQSSVLRTAIIQFRPGLNVVVGDENATNSIGKSTLLLVIDFGLGGTTLLEHNTDLVDELGHHEYTYSFRFGEDKYVFRRGTQHPEIVYRLDGGDDAVPMPLEQYTAFLKAAYEVDRPEISFRTIVGLFIRVWGRENLDVRRPLHIVKNQSAKDCIENLIKTFGRFGEIKDVLEELDAVAKKRSALRAAVRNDIVPKIGKKHYSNNEALIEQLEAELNDIKLNLAQYATNISEVVNRDVLELKLQRDDLSELRLRLASRLSRVQKNITGNRHIRSKHFDSLREFIPTVNEEKLVRVEEFHDRMARLLRDELRDSEKRLGRELEGVDNAIADIDARMSEALGSVKEPAALVDRVLAVATSLRDATRENEQFVLEQELQEAVGSLTSALSSLKATALAGIEKEINKGIGDLVSRVFGKERKSPRISLSEGGYSYAVFEDTGTGTAYAGLIVFDLTVFRSTPVPVVLHDSLLFKNIENDSVARLVEVYDEIPKQSFIAIDEIEKYGQATAEFLRSRMVIQLTNEEVLYTKDWRTPPHPVAEHKQRGSRIEGRIAGSAA